MGVTDEVAARRSSRRATQTRSDQTGSRAEDDSADYAAKGGVLMTSAHENHLFLASVFLVLWIAQPVSWFVKLSIQALLLVQFLNVYSLYEERPRWLAELLKRTQWNEMALVYSIVSVVCFAVIAKALWSSRVAPVRAPGHKPRVTFPTA